MERGTDERRPRLPTSLCKRTPLYALHVALGAKMVPFAGYEMPVQYPLGILSEHLHTRAQAGLFDVSHMGQAFLIGPDHATTARGAGGAGARPTSPACSPASSATRSSSTMTAASSTT